MKIILEATTNEYYGHKVEISTYGDDLTISAVFEELIEPMLLAWGYHPDSIKDILGDE